MHVMWSTVVQQCCMCDLVICMRCIHGTYILPPPVFLPVQPTELDTLRVAVAADEGLLDEEGEGGVGAGALESEGKDGEHQTGMRDEAEPSCQDQEECPAELKDGHNPKEPSGNKRRIPFSH